MNTMDLMSLSRRAPVHFMGVGGAGMCALAELILRSGGMVSGCDAKESPVLDDLRALGADIRVGHAASHVDGASALVVTAAVDPAHEEVARARDRGIPVVKRARALGAWVNRGRLVAVAGTHGKTTTTAMTTEILTEAGLDPTGLVGGRVAEWGGNLRFGSDDVFVVEADEYDRSFHALTPDVAVVTNVEADHLEIYGDAEGVREGFRTFLRGLRTPGRAIVCADDPGASSLVGDLGAAAYTYGLSAGCRLRAVDVTVSAAGTKCVVMEEGVRLGSLGLRVSGAHNLRNALAAAAVGRYLDAPWDAVARALADFRGVGRRFERLGEVGGISVVDDYAHHPTEIRATLAAARDAFAGRRVVAVFQPHLYSRTRDFATEFGQALAMADAVWVTDVFPAREAPIPGITGEVVVDAVRSGGGAEVRYCPELGDVPGVVMETLREGDVVVTLGAGSVETVGPRLVELLREAIHA